MRVEMFIAAWGLSFVMFVLYVVSGWARDVRARVVAKQEAKVLEVLSVLLFENDEDAKRVHVDASELPKPALLRVIQTLAVDLDGQARGRLQQLVRTNGLEKSIRRRVRARRWRIRVQAAQLQYLVTHPDHDRGVLLHDKHQLVRARAAESLTADQSADQIDRLLEMLDDPAVVVRLAAQDAVLLAGARAVPALLDRLERGEANALQALQVAANLPDARLTNALDVYAQSEDVERRRLAAQALGHGGGDATSLILERLAVDDEESVRLAAITSLASIRSQRSAAVLGRALSDRSWLVRRAAGLALDDLGAPGHMLLRRHLRDDDPFARDMARQTLDSIAARTGLSIIPSIDNPLDLADEGLVEPESISNAEPIVATESTVNTEPIPLGPVPSEPAGAGVALSHEAGPYNVVERAAERAAEQAPVAVADRNPGPELELDLRLDDAFLESLLGPPPTSDDEGANQ